jgi:hypothetical protein
VGNGNSQKMGGKQNATYKKGEGLLELRDLLFGKGVGLLAMVLSAHCVLWTEPDCPSTAGLPLQQNRKLNTELTILCLVGRKGGRNSVSSCFGFSQECQE